jgi:hypothetical protein
MVSWYAKILTGCSRVSRYVALYLKPRQRAWTLATQKRLAFTSTLLNTLKSLKMAGVSQPFREKLMGLRDIEIEASKKIRWVRVAANASGMFTHQILSPASTDLMELMLLDFSLPRLCCPSSHWWHITDTTVSLTPKPHSPQWLYWPWSLTRPTG